MPVDGFILLVVTLLPFVFVQRSLHQEVQSFFLLLTRNPTLTIILFFIMFFPGILFHELSHFLTARILFVRTGKFSLLPRISPDGRIILGSVETAPSGMLRDSIIGGAPLLAGCILVTLIAVHGLHFPLLIDLLQEGQYDLLKTALGSLSRSWEFWIWAYLALEISSTMNPSSPDRRAWLPMGITLLILVLTMLLAGAGSWMVRTFAAPLNEFSKALAMVFGCSLLLHVLLWIPFFLLRALLSRLTGRRISS